MEIFELFKINSIVSMEVIKIAYLASLIISLLVYHRRNNVPGAIIVPGSILLIAGYPLDLIIMFAAIFFTFFAYSCLQRFVFRNKIFLPKEKMLIMTLLSLVFTMAIYIVLNTFFQSITLGIIGIVTSAMIAERIESGKKSLEVLKSFLIAMTLTLLLYLMLNFLAHTYLPSQYVDFLNHSYDIGGLDRNSSIILYIIFLLTILINFIMTKYYNFQFTGLIIGAYLGILVFHPIYLLLSIISIMTGYVLINFLVKHMFLYGFRSFVMSILLCASVFSLLQHILAYYFGYHFNVFYGMNIAIFVLCGIISHDMLQKGFKAVTKASLIMGALIFLVILAIQLICRANGWTLTFV